MPENLQAQPQIEALSFLAEWNGPITSDNHGNYLNWATKVLNGLVTFMKAFIEGQGFQETKEIGGKLLRHVIATETQMIKLEQKVLKNPQEWHFATKPVKKTKPDMKQNVLVKHNTLGDIEVPAFVIKNCGGDRNQAAEKTHSYLLRQARRAQKASEKLEEEVKADSNKLEIEETKKEILQDNPANTDSNLTPQDNKKKNTSSKVRPKGKNMNPKNTKGPNKTKKAPAPAKNPPKHSNNKGMENQGKYRGNYQYSKLSSNPIKTAFLDALSNIYAGKTKKNTNFRPLKETKKTKK